jgi:hypothetical protein
MVTMLGPREREYLKDIPAFADERGRAYAKVVRSRIRKKALIGFRDLWLIFSMIAYTGDLFENCRSVGASRLRVKSKSANIRD